MLAAERRLRAETLTQSQQQELVSAAQRIWSEVFNSARRSGKSRAKRWISGRANRRLATESSLAGVNACASEASFLKSRRQAVADGAANCTKTTPQQLASECRSLAGQAWTASHQKAPCLVKLSNALFLSLEIVLILINVGFMIP